MSTSNEQKNDRREPYRPPVLTEYGTIRDITQGNVATGRNDKIGGPDKTG